MKHRLQVANNNWYDIEVISPTWYQITGVSGDKADLIGMLLRKTVRGWEIFKTLEDTSPTKVLPTRTSFVPLNLLSEEE